jgi:UDP-2,3-diacylglucosamine pyrophosphatase LpxH
MIVLVVSDFHLGKGRFLKNGQLNILEDFTLDDKFVEFTEHYSSGPYYWAKVHLVLNGDILNLIQIDVDGVFGHIVDDEHTYKQIKKIVNGHRKFFKSLKEFLAKPNKELTYVIGNHDSGMAFEKPQKYLQEIVGEGLQFCHSINIDGVHIEHGHRFEAINTVPPHHFFMKGPNGKTILNLPWGSLFCISLLPQLRKERPYLDKVRPMATYIKWCVINDFPFFLRLAYKVLKYFALTRMDIYTRHNRNFKTTAKVLKQITLYPLYARRAKSILKKDRTLHTVVMGHTHLQEWRRFPEGKFYFNTGTWNSIPSMDAGLHESHTKLTYCFLDVHSKTNTLRSGSLNVWKGKWRPYHQEVTTE